MSARSFDINKTTKQSNIRVTNNNSVTTVELHGHPVFSFIRLNQVIQLSSCGYRTVTTKTAINRAFSQLGLSYTVFQKRGLWFLNKRTEHENFYTNEEIEFVDGMSINL
jgi:hypothetical protein